MNALTSVDHLRHFSAVMIARDATALFMNDPYRNHRNLFARSVMNRPPRCKQESAPKVDAGHAP